MAHRIEREGFHPDALPALTECRAAGLRVGIAGNQPQGAVEALTAAGAHADLLASSADRGIAKPDPAFFARIAAGLTLPPDAVAHVGDRLDNDVLPAKAAGMTALLLRRGPWGVLHAASTEATRADAIIDGLKGLPALLARL